GRVASGGLNQPPVAQGRAFQIAVRTLGRLVDPKEFGKIVVKQGADSVVRLKDVGRVELAAADYTTLSYLNSDPAVALAVYQLPGSNALATAANIKAAMGRLSQSLPPGLKYSIGIGVDDAIVVVENVERNIAAGLKPREAAHRSMDEVGSALVAIALVLCAVFVPAAFISGLSGQFYRQFALTIAGATVISLIVSLTLSPALCAMLLIPHTTTTD